MQSRGIRLVWQPKETARGVPPLDRCSRRRANAGRRLVQMKAMAAEFTAADDFKISSSDQETTRHELRLLPTPVYRYEDPKRASTDGAVFAFVHGTDPEVFLVLESRSPRRQELRLALHARADDLLGGQRQARGRASLERSRALEQEHTRRPISRLAARAEQISTHS